MPSSCVLEPGETGVRRTHTFGVRRERRNSSEASKAECTWAWEEVDASSLPLEMVASWGVDGRAGQGRGEPEVPALQSRGLPGDQPVLRLSRGVPPQSLVSINSGMI